MSLPDLFARTRQPLRPETPPLANIALPGPGRTLNFIMQDQGAPDQWCWTAVTTSLVHHYHQESTLRQCDLVNEQFGRNDCCMNSTSSNCNLPASLTIALTRTGTLKEPVNSSISFEAVHDQIENLRPVACRVTWPGVSSVGHFVVLYGHSTDFSGPAPVNWVAVADPLYHGSEMPYLKFLTRYRNKATTWTHSYFTKP
jgi:hypothetical protein